LKIVELGLGKSPLSIWLLLCVESWKSLSFFDVLFLDVSLISRSCFSVSSELSTSVHRCVGVKYEGRIFSPVNVFFCGGQNLLKFTIAEGLYTWHIPTHTLLSSNKQYLKRHISTRTNIFFKKNLFKITDIARLHCSSRLFMHLVWLVLGILLQRVFSLMQGYNPQSWFDFDFGN